jgi:branched-chain amino acid transport system permease protein
MTTLLIGLSLGMLLLLLSAGLSLIFGMLGVVNFAHGGFYMLGAYLGFQVAQWTGNFWLALVISPLITAAVGAAVEMLTLRPLYGPNPVFQVLLTFGIVLLIYEATRTIWGLGYQTIAPPAALADAVHLGSIEISAYRLFIIGFGALVAAAMFVVLERTPVGVLIRAASANSAMVACLGVDIALLRTGVFAFGTGLAALGGVIAGPVSPIQLEMGFAILIDCFMVVVIGGLGNIRGAVIGALLIGLIRAYGARYLASWIDVLTYSIFVLVLLIRPQGLFATAERRA